MAQNQQAPDKPNSNNVWLILAAVAILGGVAWFSLRAPQTQPPPPTEQRVQAPVKFPTLSPSRFTGKTREAYQAAQDIPEVLQQVQCYCGCRRSDGHENNLMCYLDDHAVG